MIESPLEVSNFEDNLTNTGCFGNTCSFVSHAANNVKNTVLDVVNPNANLSHKSNMKSLVSMMLLFYLAIANNYTDRLLSREMQVAIRESRFAQHLIGFLLLMVVVFMVGNVDSVEHGLVYSVIGYGWFVLSTKLDLRTNIVILSLMVLAFLYEQKILAKLESVSKDLVLSAEEKLRYTRRHLMVKKTYIALIAGLTVAGAGYYCYKHCCSGSSSSSGQSGGGSQSLMEFIFY